VPLTPEDIEKKEFMIELRGYDKSQVHSFLKQVAAEYRDAREGGGGDGPDPIDGLTASLANILRGAIDEAAAIVAAARLEADKIMRLAAESAAAATSGGEAGDGPPPERDRVTSAVQGLLDRLGPRSRPRGH
jgi:DivIVA domain-containing protein